MGTILIQGPILPNIQDPVLGTAGIPGGLDWLISIQILLVQDYDSQLKHLGNRMKTANEVKKSYRRIIENHQRLLIREPREMDDQDWIPVSEKEFEELNHLQTFVGNEFAESPSGMVKSHSDPLKGEEAMNTKTKDGRLYVLKDNVEQKITLLETKLDTVNENSEIMSLNLQSLTHQRKNAFETVSNLFRKEADTLNTIVRNIAG